MWQPQTTGDPTTYTNPVYERSFPDPFVLKFRDEYFAYSTGFAEDGLVFGVLRSRDLVNWNYVGGAMQPLENSPPYYWAPEVTYDNGKFYLYYSVGNETFMELRVAVSSRPDGGFVDSGTRLTTEDFAIDAHVFVDDDGQKYLFYATDFLEHTHIGTGTVVDRMLDWFTLEGDPRPVTRARFDWQVYDPQRKEKGGVRWHTVEGPTVLKRKGRYFEMFSGGNWQNTTYGVSFAVSDRIDNPDEWLQFSDGANVLPILRTIPEIVVGPGHNSVVVGPNDRELYCVYHRWTEAGRVLAIDRMDFIGDRIMVIGASHTPQPFPFKPAIEGLRSNNLQFNGDWKLDHGTATSPGRGDAGLGVSELSRSFLCTLSVCCAGMRSDDGRVGLRFGDSDEAMSLTFHPVLNTVRVEVPANSTGLPSISKLPPDFDWNADHVIRVEIDHRRLTVKIDEHALKLSAFLGAPIDSFSLFSRNQAITIGAFRLTRGYEELFEHGEPLTENGWSVLNTEHHITGGELIFESGQHHVISKGRPADSFEFAANFRTTERDLSTCEFGLAIENDGREIFRFAMDVATMQIMIDVDRVGLPTPIDPGRYHQLRLIKIKDQALCYLDDVLVADRRIENVAASPSLFCNGGRLAVEMVRFTVI